MAIFKCARFYYKDRTDENATPVEVAHVYHNYRMGTITFLMTGEYTLVPKSRYDAMERFITRPFRGNGNADAYRENYLDSLHIFYLNDITMGDTYDLLTD